MCPSVPQCTLCYVGCGRKKCSCSLSSYIFFVSWGLVVPWYNWKTVFSLPPLNKFQVNWQIFMKYGLNIMLLEATVFLYFVISNLVNTDMTFLWTVGHEQWHSAFVLEVLCGNRSWKKYMHSLLLLSLCVCIKNLESMFNSLFYGCI